MNTVKPMYEWKAIPWRKIERNVFKLQKRIYQASRRGDVKAVHRLQRLLMKSWSARCLAVRKVTQDNRGKRTAGVDGVRNLTPNQRLELVERLNLECNPQPIRRVWIPKPGKAEKRGLGIPTMFNRAQQTLVKLALEPEWEAKFEPNSYGFRPGRSCHDAIYAIFLWITKLPHYVLDADIAKCFDRINQERLLEKLNTFPKVRRLIKTWLKAGVLDGQDLFPTETGVPQGGPISPLLANVALHGLETAITSAYPTLKTQQGKRIAWKPKLVRYADDLVVLHRDLEVIQEIQEMINHWLEDMGLELKPSKTRITHTLTPHGGKVGFDFLGFNVRQFQAGRTHTGVDIRGNRLGFKTIIKPSNTAIQRHLRILQDIIKRHIGAPQIALINHLNPVIRGWTQYYAPVASSRAFSKLTHLTFVKLRRWAKRRHSKLSWKKIAPKYWQLEAGRWFFATKERYQLYRHSQTAIRRHIKVKGSRSPFDGDWIYWAKRLGRHPELPKRIAILFHRQKGKCAWCGLHFKHEDRPEIDHIIPTSQDGKDEYNNWQLLHAHCHDIKSARDFISRLEGSYDKSQSAEEPCDAKVSSTVLKPSGGGDPAA
jgi:RNA-directed DNA polymerase